MRFREVVGQPMVIASAVLAIVVVGFTLIFHFGREAMRPWPKLFLPGELYSAYQQEPDFITADKQRECMFAALNHRATVERVDTVIWNNHPYHLTVFAGNQGSQYTRKLYDAEEADHSYRPPPFKEGIMVSVSFSNGYMIIYGPTKD